MQRTVTPELLDSDSGSPAEIAASLGDLRRINRWFGSISCMMALVGRVAQASGQKKLSVLDVGAGSGDIAAQVTRELGQRGVEVDFTLMDRAASHFSSAQSNGQARRVSGDALALPFGDASFDVVACSTFLHHLEPAEALRFVNDALRVVRLAVVINDLRRHPLHLALVYSGISLFRSRITRHDAPASVRRAYTLGEIESMLKQSAAARIEITEHYLFRIGAIAWAK